MRKQSEKEKHCRENIAEINAERDKLDKRFNYWYSRLKKEIENILSYVEKMTVKNADWTEILAIEFPEGTIRYNKYNDLMHEFGFWPGEYYQETMQRCIKIMLRKSNINEFIKQTFKNLKKVLPFVKPIKCKDGRRYKVIQIFCDHEGGIPELLVKNDGKACVAFTCYGRY